MNGVGVSPYDPSHNSTAVLVGMSLFDLFHSPMIECSVERDDQPLFASDVELLIMLLLLLFLFFLCVVRLPSF